MNYDSLCGAVRECKACPLGGYEQGVLGKWGGEEVDRWRREHPEFKTPHELGGYEGQDRLMILGEAPGGVEMARGEPFVGQSGELLRSLLKEVGLTSYYLSNMVRHQPPKVKGKQQAPDKVAVAACAPFLRAEFELVKPTHLILLGATAAKLVVEGQFAMKDVVNTTHKYLSRWLPITMAPGSNKVVTPAAVVPTLILYHPSYFLRNRTSPWIQKAVREWKQALRLFMGDKAPAYRIERVRCETHG